MRSHACASPHGWPQRSSGSRTIAGYWTSHLAAEASVVASALCACGAGSLVVASGRLAPFAWLRGLVVASAPVACGAESLVVASGSLVVASGLLVVASTLFACGAGRSPSAPFAWLPGARWPPPRTSLAAPGGALSSSSPFACGSGGRVVVLLALRLRLR